MLNSTANPGQPLAAKWSLVIHLLSRLQLVANHCPGFVVEFNIIWQLKAAQDLLWYLILTTFLVLIPCLLPYSCTERQNWQYANLSKLSIDIIKNEKSLNWDFVYYYNYEFWQIIVILILKLTYLFGFWASNKASSSSSAVYANSLLDVLLLIGPILGIERWH